MSVKWNGKKEISVRSRQIAENMKVAVVFAEGKAKRLVSKGNKTGRTPSKPTGGWNGLGEPPRVVTGMLRSSIGHSVKITPKGVSGFLGVRTGVANRYAFFLEFGTSKMIARPFLRPTIANNKKVLLRMIAIGK